MLNPLSFHSYENIDSGHFKSYSGVVPDIYRDKDKFWYVIDSKNRFKLRRLEGPAMLSNVKTWSIGDGLDYFDIVVDWCRARDLDPDDLSEEDAVVMWSEIIQ